MKSPEFFEHNPANRDSARQLLGERERLSPDLHPTKFLATRLIASASEHLKEVDRSFLEQYESSHEVGAMVWEAGAKHISRIMFGAVVIGVHDAKADGKVYAGELVDRVNMELGKTMCQKIKLGDGIPAIRPLTELEQTSLQSADETYSDLFENPKRLPKEFGSLLTANQRVSRYIEENAQKWRDLASVVLDAFTMGGAAANDISGMGDIPGIEILTQAGMSGDQIRRLMAFKERVDKRGS